MRSICPNLIVHYCSVLPMSLCFKIISTDPISFLRNPVTRSHIPEPSIRKKVAKQLRMSFGSTMSFWLELIPQVMPRWTKVRIGNGGDLIRGAIAHSASVNERNLHDASFVRYELNIDIKAHLPKAELEFVQQVFYGHLEYILECAIPPNRVSKNGEPRIHLLAVITTLDTEGHDATSELTYFKLVSSYVEVVDLNAVCAVVGRLRVGKVDPRWAIVDRSGSWSRTVFKDDSLSMGAQQDIGS
ncbi:uncharacterized protein EI90DRAFT_3293054 [Cantharellus anzutake]|uniref:uncharacterized protein n=1 Tax=Cantharellus anzutake TaxID=1750568 RepID=UPI001904F598|nr:uncharacterized protein EI90DRAFT_3293054 [Cantharellus anzutake]KAF8319571.1 hypothetical protein EI90DRAFT_3293054 [Cantharellus anzutake]